MAQVLHLRLGQSGTCSGFGELQRLLSEIEKRRTIQLSIANGLWAQEGRPFLPALLDAVRNNYQAGINQVDFKTGAAAATDDINQWVAQQTHDRIQNLIARGALNELTRLVLVNAIYFKGDWASPFSKDETQPQPFHLTSSNQITAPLMHRLDTVRYLDQADFQAVEIPYAGGDLSMVILLPRQIDGCGQVERQLNEAFFSRALSQMLELKVQLYIPRFKLESSFDLAHGLAEMGMADAFTFGRADFSGIDGRKLLYISTVIHKAWAEINEEGTEAAAATAVMLQFGASLNALPPPPIPVFRADHPFLFLIRDTHSGSVLFLGRVADPSK